MVLLRRLGRLLSAHVPWRWGVSTDSGERESIWSVTR